MRGRVNAIRTFKGLVADLRYFSCKAKYVEKEYTFSIAGKKVTVKVKHYLGVEFVYTNQSSSMHGGGSIG